MSFDYHRLRLSAARLIYQAGDATVVKTYVDVPSPDGIDPPTRTYKEWATRAVWTKYKQEDIDGTLVRQGDQVVLLTGDADKLPVKSNGEIVRGSEAWKIIQIEVIKPGPVTIIYKVQVRK